MAAVAGNAVCFGPFKLDLKAGELHQDGRKILLQEQPFQVLKMLLEHPGQVFTREEIRKKLWPNDTIVEFDHSINAAIKSCAWRWGIQPRSRSMWRRWRVAAIGWWYRWR